MTQTIVLAGVDGTDAGTKVLAAAKAASRRSGAPLLLTHVVTSMWGANIPAFQLDETTDRRVEHGPPGARILAVAAGYDAELIVVGTRGKRWRSVARQVARRASCPVMIVGPAADPEAPAIEAAGFDRAQLRRSPVPVVVLPTR